MVDVWKGWKKSEDNGIYLAASRLFDVGEGGEDGSVTFRIIVVGRRLDEGLRLGWHLRRCVLSILYHCSFLQYPTVIH